MPKFKKPALQILNRVELVEQMDDTVVTYWFINPNFFINSTAFLSACFSIS